MIACAIVLLTACASAPSDAQTAASLPVSAAAVPAETTSRPMPAAEEDAWAGLLIIRHRQLQIGEGSRPERTPYLNVVHKKTGAFIEQTVIQSPVLMRAYTLAGMRAINEKRLQVSPYAGYQRHETPALESDNVVVGARMRVALTKRFSIFFPFFQADLPTTEGARRSLLVVARPTVKLTERDFLVSEWLVRKNRDRPVIAEGSLLFGHRFGKAYTLEGGYMRNQSAQNIFRIQISYAFSF